MKKNVLVVDDEIGALTLQGIMLERGGFNVLKAKDADVALAILDQNTPDLIILDVMMPGINGIELCKIIRQRQDTIRIPVLFLSGRGDANSVMKGMEAGANDYLPKPILNHDLVAKVRAILAGVEETVQKADKNTPVAPPTRGQIMLLSSTEPFYFGAINRAFTMQAYPMQLALLKDIDSMIDAKLTTDFRSKIALLSPSALLLDIQSISIIEKLRRFALSSHLPLIVVIRDQSDRRDSIEYLSSTIDEITSLDPEIAIQAVQRAIQQYDSPALVQIGKTWQIMIVSADNNLAQAIHNGLISTFYVDALIVESLEAIASEISDLDLLFIDEALSADIQGAIRTIRRADIDVPILLLVNHITEELERSQYELGIRGFLHKTPLVKEHIEIQIKRLLRWGQQIRTLTEHWADYRIQATEAEFKHLLCTQKPLIASLYIEMGARYSGLIHDLRNAIGLTEEHARRIKGADELRASIHLASILLEIIAEARFKGSWRVREHNAQSVRDMFNAAIVNVRQARPTFKVTLNLPSQLPILLGDIKQLETALTALLFTISAKANSINLSVRSDKKTLYIQLSKPSIFSQSRFLKTLPTCVEDIDSSPNVIDLYLLTALKLFSRHNAEIGLKNSKYVVSLMTGGWGDEKSLRLDIAQSAKISELFSRPVPEPLPTIDTLAPLIVQTIFDFMDWCHKIVQLSQSHGEKLIKSSRYTLLLVLDMLYASVGYTVPSEPVDLGSVIHTFIDLRGDRLGQCTMNIDIAQNLPSIVAEELGLLQILVNLVTNAVEAMHGKGQLMIRAYQENQFVRLDVKDTGPGISESEQEKIFDLFYTTKQGHERGIGLHIVKTLVAQFKGVISIDSSEDGTTFSILFPIA